MNLRITYDRVIATVFHTRGCKNPGASARSYATLDYWIQTELTRPHLPACLTQEKIGTGPAD